ncbi:hypothetical protein ACFQZE_10875 [Paenibacillus sp. GCM10027627]|uniref:hypothetical protein n=1 Tax=unclassified Paenibacillus TaxID=185978 RepID=UPI00362ED477
MKTNEVTPYHFSAKFGSEHIAVGSFTYYECENGLGIIKDQVKQTVHFVNPPHVQVRDLTEEEEFNLLTAVCGDFKPDLSVPMNDTLADYELREKKASRRFAATWTAIVGVLLACTLLTLFLFSYLTT